MDTKLWRYRDRTATPDTSNQLEGFQVEAADGHIGKVDEATERVGRSSIVVDTGPWIFGKKVVIPAGAIERIDMENRKVHVNLTKEQIKNAPEYDPDRDYDNDDYYAELDIYYVAIVR
jgi:hypothetical protein